jgi:signal transduction histidine kinase
MQNLDAPDVREEEWEPWLQLLSILHPHRSWDSFCAILTRNLQVLTGAQILSVAHRGAGADIVGWPAATPPSPAILPEQVGEVRSDGAVTCVMAYRSAEFSAWLVFVDAGRWNLAQILARIAAPIGQLLARVRSFEEMRSSLEQALPPVAGESGQLMAIRKEELGALLSASSAASRTPTLMAIREAADRLDVCWLDADGATQSITPDDAEVAARLDDALVSGQEVSLRGALAERLAGQIGSSFGEMDWFYFVPVRSGGAVVALVGAGLARPAPAFEAAGSPSLLQDLSAFPNVSSRRIRQAQLLELLRVIADELGEHLVQAHLREFALTDGMLRERAHLGIDLHDSILQDLTYLQLQLGRLDQVITEDPERAKTILGQLQSQLQMTSREARELAVGLTASTASSDLRELLEPVVERFRNRFDGRVDLRAAGTARQSPPSINSQATRILQEVLNNVWKHAAASRVTVELRYEPDSIRLVVADNGRGFVMEERASGQLGLRGIHERAQEIGATVEVHSEPARGTTVTVRLPA